MGYATWNSRQQRLYVIVGLYHSKTLVEKMNSTYCWNCCCLRNYCCLMNCYCLKNCCCLLKSPSYKFNLQICFDGKVWSFGYLDIPVKKKIHLAYVDGTAVTIVYSCCSRKHLQLLSKIKNAPKFYEGKVSLREKHDMQSRDKRKKTLHTQIGRELKPIPWCKKILKPL